MSTEQEKAPGIVAASLSRRTILGAVSTALVAGTGLALGSPAEANHQVRGSRLGHRLSTRDEDILNFALNLEYLEAEFYLFATTGAGLGTEDTQSTRRGARREVNVAGTTTGGARVPFEEGSVLQATARELAVDEVDHVRLLRAVLGARAVAKPAINLAALGVGFGSETEFLTVARIFEDIGVSAYLGAAPLIVDRGVLAAAAAILGTEAYHAGNIRLQVVQRNVTTPKVDAKDQPPTDPAPNPPNEDPNFFPTDENGLTIPRTVPEVLALVRPFFPNGLNGPIR